MIKMFFIVVSVYKIYGTDISYVIAFTKFFGLGWLSLGTLGLFLLLSLHWPVFTHWECVISMVLCDALCFETTLLITVFVFHFSNDNTSSSSS
jgi:hypothetical protein